jgi:SAM-dependent methyltransferase
MSYYTDKQYAEDFPKNAKRDLNLLFFDSFLKNSKKILDIGCSLGRIISISPEKIQGIDIDNDALKIAKERGYNVKYANVTKKLPFKNNSFDAIYCSHLVEHLDDPLYLMKEIKRILKKNGRGVIITPDYIMTSRKYKNGFWCDYTHKRPFIPHTLEEISYDAGFKKIRVYHFPGFGFRNLIRWDLLSKDTWIKLEKLPFIWKGQDLVLEIIK